MSAKTELGGATSAKKRSAARVVRSRFALKDKTMTRGPRKSVEEVAAAQGVKPTRLDDVLGKGADLWDSDLELERFVEDIYARRKEDRELAKQ